MDTIVIKFGGSSVADNSKLQLVANKVIKLYDEASVTISTTKVENLNNFSGPLCWGVKAAE